MAQMRAVVAERPHGPDGLVVREVPRPEPRPGWALVRVEAFGLNRSEYKTLKGYAGDAVTFPRILGIELVGVVEAVHGDAPAVPPGETVAALMGEMGRAFDGGYAEYALVPEHQLITLDTTLPWDVLGALSEAGADGAVDLIGGPAVLETLRLLHPGATACNSGSLSDTWVIPDFEPIAMIPSGRKLTAFHSNDVHDAQVGGPLLRAVVEQVERGKVAPNIDAVYTLEQTIDAHRRMAADEATGKLVVLPRAATA